MSKYRKAIAAFITPILGLPFAAWAAGEAVFNAGTVASAVVAGITAALVFLFPNDQVVQ